MKRMQSGKNLFLEGRVHLVEEKGNSLKFIVKSNGFKEVLCLDSYWSCSCYDYFIRHVKEGKEYGRFSFGIMPCKHLYACMFYLENREVE